MAIHIQLIKCGVIIASFPQKDHALQLQFGAAAIFHKGQMHKVFSPRSYDTIEFNNVLEDDEGEQNGSD